ncbi:MAG: M17 family peptidase N-terminal domain-containing protein, partial [Nitrospinota bacterium]
MLKIKTLSQELLKTETELIVVSLFNDVIPIKGDAGYIDWLLNGQISNLIKKKKVFGNFKESVLLSSCNKIPSEKILLVGFGKASHLTSPKLSYIFSAIMDIIHRIKIKDFGI